MALIPIDAEAMQALRTQLLSLAATAPPQPAALAHAAMLLGLDVSRPGVREPAQVATQSLPQWRPDKIDLAAWWHAVPVVRAADAGPWQEWRQALSSTALAAQRVDAPYAGSWDGLGGDLGGGRVAATALMVLTLAAASAPAVLR